MEKNKSLIFFLILFILIILFNIFILSFLPEKIATPTSQASIQFSIAKSEAIKIEAESFDGDTTDFTFQGNLKFKNMTNLTLEKSSFGKIIFTESIDLTQDAVVSDSDYDLFNKRVNLDDNIIISKNLIEINTENLKSLEKPATLYLYGLTFNNPRILRNNEVCSPTICQIIDYSNGILKFSVTGFTSYSSEEIPTEAKAVGGACAYDWECTTWLPLVCAENERQVRTCTNKGTCVGIIGKPDETRTCLFEQPEKKPLLDLKIIITELGREIFPGETIIIKIELINFGGTKRVDTFLKYKITDSEDKIIFSEIETLAFETKINLIKEIKLPEDLKIGRYILEVNATYDGQTASALTEFQVVKASQKEKIFIAIILILIIMLGVLIYIIIRQKEKYILIKKADLKKLINQK